MSAISFLLRDAAQRGIRVRAGHMGLDVPEGAHQIWSIIRRGHRIVRDENDNELEGERGCSMEILAPRLSGGEPNGRPVLWWLLERKVGEEITTKKSKGQVVEVPVGIYAPDWEVVAGTMVDSVRQMLWVFENGVIGEAFAPRAEWLACNVCDEAQLLPKQAGAATAKRKCHMTHNCSGIVRRLPMVFDVTAPKPKPKPRAPKEAVVTTPGAERFKQKAAAKNAKTTVEEWISDGDASYVEDGADREVA